MSFKMNGNLLNFDVFPLVYRVNEASKVHIRPLGGKNGLIHGQEYEILITGLNGGISENFPLTAFSEKKKLTWDGENGVIIDFTFPSEQEYFINIIGTDGKPLHRFSVYAVEGELTKRYPYIGDLHIHTTRSDGREAPAVVCANYRRHGYDFMAVTDHRRYYPSLEAIEAYKDVPHEMNLATGEEVHLPPVFGKTNDVHIVSFGADYSINALIEGTATQEKGTDLKYRAVRETDVPDVMTLDEYMNKMQSLAEKTDVPENVEKIPYVVCRWIFDEIRRAGGLGIFAHPNWIKGSAFHIPESFTDYMLNEQPFDAFEVLGGEMYYEQNGFQTMRYYEEKAKGHTMPIVGSTDSHGSYSTNKQAFICSTVVFARENSTKELIKSIKSRMSVAVDTVNEDFRLVGETRLVRYTCFLLKYYFPLHDELCIEEGRLMKEYVTGTDEEKQEAKRLLTAIYGRVERQRKKYFAF